MSKAIHTFLGPADIIRQSLAPKKGRIHIQFRPPYGLQILKATRLESVSEPNTYLWRVEGLKNFPPSQEIAPNARTAIQAFLSTPSVAPEPSHV